MVASPPEILILHVVVPLPHANFLTAVAPSNPLFAVLNVHAPEVPPKVNSSVPTPSELIWLLLKVEETAPNIWLLRAPAVFPSLVLAMTSTSPALSVEALVTKSQVDTPSSPGVA